MLFTEAPFLIAWITMISGLYGREGEWRSVDCEREADISQSIFLYTVKGEDRPLVCDEKTNGRLAGPGPGPGPVQVQAQTWGMVVTGAEGAGLGKSYLSSKSAFFKAVFYPWQSTLSVSFLTGASFKSFPPPIFTCCTTDMYRATTASHRAPISAGAVYVLPDQCCDNSREHFSEFVSPWALRIFY